MSVKRFHTTLRTAYNDILLNRLHRPKLKIAYLELTNECNLKCVMCSFQKARKKTGYMPIEAFQSYVNQLSDIGVQSLFLQLGGESLLHPNFKELLTYVIQKRDETRKIGNVLLATNGTLFDQSIADLVVDLKVDSIYFSVDGIGHVNDNIRLGSQYSRIEKNIKYLLKKRGKAKKPFVNLNIIDCGKTEEQRMEFFREWIHLVDQIIMHPLILPDNTIGNIKTFSKCRKTPTPFCKAPFTQIVISWDGKVTACPLDYSLRMALGDATKTPIKQIWRGSKYRALRKAALTKNFPNDSPCFRCEFWEMNFENRREPILDGKAEMIYGDVYTFIKKTP